MSRIQYGLILIVAVVSGLIGGGVSNWLFRGELAFAQKPPHTEVIRAGKFEVVDKDGKVRAGLMVKDGESPTLSLFDKEGNDLVLMSLSSTGEAVLAFRDKGPKARLSLTLLKEGPRVDLWDTEGKNIRAALRTGADGAPLLELFNKYTERRAAFGIDKDDKPGLSFDDQTGKTRLTLGLEGEGVAFLRLLDKENVARAGLSVGAEGTPAGLSLQGKGGNVRAVLATGTDSNPVLNFLDEGGQIIWKAPQPQG